MITGRADMGAARGRGPTSLLFQTHLSRGTAILIQNHPVRCEALPRAPEYFKSKEGPLHPLLRALFALKNTPAGGGPAVERVPSPRMCSHFLILSFLTDQYLNTLLNLEHPPQTV